MRIQSSSLTQKNTIEVGSFIHFGARYSKETYKIVRFEESDAHILVCKNIYQANVIEKEFILEELFAISEPPFPIFAQNLETLNMQLERNETPFEPLNKDLDIPQCHLDDAIRLINIYEFIEDEIKTLENKCILQGKKFNRTNAVNEACKKTIYLPDVKLAISKSTYYNYRNLYLTFSGNLTKIAASLRKKSCGQLLVDLAEQNFAAALILKYVAGDETRFSRSLTYIEGKKILRRTQQYWVDPNKCDGGKVPSDLIDELFDYKIPFERILANPEKMALLSKISMPSLPWFYKYCRWFIHNPKAGESRIRNQFGDEFYENEILVFNKYINIAQFPLQYVFADHCILDVFIIDKESRKTAFRLWLTLLIDVWSRCVLGYVLLDEHPSVESIQLALRNAIWPKIKILKNVGIDPKYWPCYGIPLSLSLDNAWAHLSLSLEDLARSIGQTGTYDSIEIVLRPPFLGRYGAIVERYFGFIQSRLKKYFIGSYKKSTPQAIRSAKNQASQLFEDLDIEILKIIVDYQNTIHSELGGMTPNQKWEQSLNLRKPAVPPLTQEMERLFWRKCPVQKQLSNRGISFLGMHYSDELLHDAQRIDILGEKVKYDIRWSPTDISRIAIFRGERWLGDAYSQELKLANGKYWEIGLLEKKLAKEIAKSLGDIEKNWVDYLDKTTERMNQRQKESRRIAKIAKGEPTDSLASELFNKSNISTSVVHENNYDNLTINLARFNREG